MVVLNGSDNINLNAPLIVRFNVKEYPFRCLLKNHSLSFSFCFYAFPSVKNALVHVTEEGVDLPRLSLYSHYTGAHHDWPSSILRQNPSGRAPHPHWIPQLLFKLRKGGCYYMMEKYQCFMTFKFKSQTPGCTYTVIENISMDLISIPKTFCIAWGQFDNFSSFSFYLFIFKFYNSSEIGYCKRILIPYKIRK